jgi:ketosteroid isomerase-like protein
MVQAFNNRDAAALVANWTDDGEYSRNDDVPFRGRAEIQKGYAGYFKMLKGKPKVEVQIDGLRFPSADTAYSEVTLRLKNEEGEVVASSWRNTLFVRENGQWKVAIVSEWDRDELADVSLKELEWLIGTWHAATKEREVTTTYEWDENKAFIRGKYTVKEGAKVIESGTQMIAKDKAEGAMRSWVFQSDGGFGDGLWTREGIIRGNYYNALGDTTVQVYGSVDKKSQRAAWTVGDKKEPIYEAGFANLTKSETTMMVHFGKDKSQQWRLVRIEEPAEKK